MAKKNTFKITLPDGTVATRTTARTYTHVLVAVPATQAARHAALNRDADERMARAEVLLEAAFAGKVLRRDRGFGPNTNIPFHAFDYLLAGTEIQGNRVKYHEIYERGNDEGLHETWRRYVPEGVEIARETTEDHSKEMQVAVPVRPLLIAKARERAAELREQAAQLRVQANEPDTKGYEALRWSSRYDLAAKSTSEFEYQLKVGRTLKVLPVDEA